jgi:F-type H+-transporting ATPase subunit b
MEFLGSLGIDIRLLIAQMVNFGLLLWLLTKFLYKPIIKRIEKDESELKQARVQREELARQKNAFEEQKKREVIEAKKRAQEIIKEAEEVAEEIKRRARAEAEQEKQAVIRQIKSRLSEIEHEEKHS